MADGVFDFADASIDIISTETYETLLSATPDQTSGNFTFELSSGNYMINFVKPEYNIYTHLVDLTSGDLEESYLIYPYLEKTVPDIVEPVVIAAAIEETTPVEEPLVIEEIISEPVPEPVVEETATYDYTPESQTDYSYSDGKYTIQIMASVIRIEPENVGSLNIEIQKGDDDYYRYIAGSFNTLAEAESAKKEIRNSKYKDAFIRYYNLEDYLTNPIRHTAYTIQIMALNREVDLNTFKQLAQIRVSYGDDQIYRYTTGEYASLALARNELQEIVTKGYKTAFIKATSKISNY